MRVIESLDVSMSCTALGPEVEFYQFIFPLRPINRHYRINEMKSMRLHRSARKIEFVIPQDMPSAHIDMANPLYESKPRTMTLRSMCSCPLGLFYIAIVQKTLNQVFLLPLRYIMQMRPSFDYLTKATYKDCQQPNVQQERHNSEDSWRQLNVSYARVEVADTLMRSIEILKKTPWCEKINATSHLKKTKNKQSLSELARENPGNKSTRDLRLLDRTLSSSYATLSCDKKSEIIRLTHSAVHRVGVVTLSTVRHVLHQSNKFSFVPPDTVLHQLLMTPEARLLCVQDAYFFRSTGIQEIDAIRDLAIAELKGKNWLKKREIRILAAAKGIEMKDKLFHVVMKELCQSKGAFWSLKAGSF